MPTRPEVARRSGPRTRRKGLRKFLPATSLCRAALEDNRPLGSFSSAGTVAHGLDIVAVEIEHEGAVVIGMVMRAKARFAVVLPSRGDGRMIEGIDRRAGSRDEGHMDVPAETLALADPEGRLAALKILRRAGRTEANGRAMTCLLGR